MHCPEAVAAGPVTTAHRPWGPAGRGGGLGTHSTGGWRCCGRGGWRKEASRPKECSSEGTAVHGEPALERGRLPEGMACMTNWECA